jgi:hypothetical protein
MLNAKCRLDDQSVALQLTISQLYIATFNALSQAFLASKFREQFHSILTSNVTMQNHIHVAILVQRTFIIQILI